MAHSQSNPLQQFFTDLPPKDRDLLVLSLDLQLALSKSKTDEEKQDLLEARILKQID